MSTSVNLRKAAILLASLPPDDAAALLSKLPAKQVETVSIEIAKLGRIPGEEQSAVLNEFADANPSAIAGGSGSFELAKAIMEKALGANASEAVNNVRQSVAALPFGFLKQVDPTNLLTFIVDEHPQTIALVLSHLAPAYGAKIVKDLPPDRQLAVIRRLAYMGQTNPEVVKEVEKGLELRMASLVSQSFDKAGGVDSVAEILNVTDRATERALMENLAQEDAELVEEIRRLMFVFDDIAKLTDKDIQAILKNVENNQWTMALKGAKEELKTRILGNMSQRAAATLKEEMDFLGAVKQSEVERVQQQIVDVVRKLEDSGQISTHSSDESEAYVT